ncbi:MAG: molybdopterin molybdotransferase MoeA [Leptospiraceae bacterium]|nr:molybdopterin molybdotransferase MoeA [Leptospiraceae bacterium]
MLDFQTAINALHQHLPVADYLQRPAEQIALHSAMGRVLAKDLRADRDLPPFPRSMMDGFAIRSADFESQRDFMVIGTALAGQEHDLQIGAGEAVRIMTGAAVPAGADSVIKIEETSAFISGRSGSVAPQTTPGNVRFNTDSVNPGQNISPRGEEAHKGDVLAASGTTIDVSVLTLAAATGQTQLAVRALPNVSIIVTGDELVAVEDTPGPHQIRNSNGPMLSALLEELGVQARTFMVADRPDAIRSLLDRVLDEADFVLLTGGVSAGDTDFVPGLLAEAGVQSIFHKVRMRPGKPIWAGARKQTMVFGLPGPPFSCRITFKLFVEPAVRRCMGIVEASMRSVPMQTARSKKHDLIEFFRARVVYSDEGAPSLFNIHAPAGAHSIERLQVISHRGSSDVTATLQSTGIGVHPANQPELRPGDAVLFLPW